MKSRSVIIFLIAAVVAFMAGYFCGQNTLEVEPTQTVVRVDTVFYEKPQPIRMLPPTFATVRVSRVVFAPTSTITSIIEDNVASLDSVEVQVLIEKKQYGDSTYRAQVSGPAIGTLGPSLDWIEVYNRTNTITQTITKRSRFAVTAGVGAAYTPQGFQPYVGVGVGVVLWQW